MSDSTAPLQDRIHYPGGAWEHSHPDRIAANARLYGLHTAVVERARILEFGCGAGGNLIPMAYGLPDARLVGIERATGSVERGQRRAASLGLSNIDLRECDILDLPADLGEFDYIIAHGVYSWVPAPVRDALMAAISRHLAPAGIAYLNYNAYPGGHLRALVRDMMQFRTKAFENPEAHCEDAVRFVRLVAGAQPEGSPYRRILEAELDRIECNPVNVLLHDDLLPAQQAFHFAGVLGHAARHGLQYLCEARPADVHPGRYPEGVRAAMRRFGGDRLAREQCFDYLVCQTYRCSLFCRTGIVLAPRANLEGLGGLRAASPLLPARARVNLTDGIPVDYRAQDGAAARFDDSVAKAALQILAELWPASAGIGPLHGEARKRAARTGPPTGMERREFAAFLVSNHALGFIDHHTWEPPMTVAVSARPVASALARAEITDGTRVTSLRHRQVDVDDFLAAVVLPRLDGARDRAALLEDVRRDIPGAAIAAEEIETVLAGFAYHCLLQG